MQILCLLALDKITINYDMILDFIITACLLFAE